MGRTSLAVDASFATWRLGPAWALNAGRPGAGILSSAVRHPARCRGHGPLGRRQRRVAVVHAIVVAVAIRFGLRRLRRVIAAIIEIDFSLAGDKEVAGAPIIGEDVIRFDSLLLDRDREVGIDLATDADGVAITIDERELGLRFGLAILVRRLRRPASTGIAPWTSSQAE